MNDTDWIAIIRKTGPGRCSYCRRQVEESLTVGFPEGTTRIFCQRDALKQILMRGENPGPEADIFSIGNNRDLTAG